MGSLRAAVRWVYVYCLIALVRLTTGRPVLKAITFSLNEPVKELLYMPTSEAVKFKAKAWIDVFGARCAKALGSYITNIANGEMRK